jgi:hypothetical protein
MRSTANLSSETAPIGAFATVSPVSYVGFLRLLGLQGLILIIGLLLIIPGCGSPVLN